VQAMIDAIEGDGSQTAAQFTLPFEIITPANI
jgi:hypothetical protein